MRNGQRESYMPGMHVWKWRLDLGRDSDWLPGLCVRVRAHVAGEEAGEHGPAGSAAVTTSRQQLRVSRGWALGSCLHAFSPWMKQRHYCVCFTPGNWSLDILKIFLDITQKQILQLGLEVRSASGFQLLCHPLGLQCLPLNPIGSILIAKVMFKGNLK